MFVVKLRTPFRANYEHFYIYLAYRRQTGTVVTRQTYDRAPRLTRPPTAHISRGGHTLIRGHFLRTVPHLRHVKEPVRKGYMS